MKKLVCMSLAAIGVLACSIDLSYSRGGFGGGRGGFGGGHGSFGGAEFRGAGAGPSGHFGGEQRRQAPREFNERQGERRAKPQSETRPASRRAPVDKGGIGNHTDKPTRENLQKFLNLPPESSKGLSDLGKAGIGGAAAGALGVVGAQHLMERAGADGRRTDGARPARINRDGAGERRSGDRISDRDRQNADQIRNNIKDRYDNLFTPQWWKDHPQLAHQYWENMGRYQYAWNHWWRPAAWGALAGWIAGTAWSAPQYYDYSSEIYYQGDSVYVNDAPVASAQEYYQQAAKITTAPEDKSSQEEELMPLGVFALSQTDSTSSNTLLQLSVDKQGIIKGIYYNTNTNTSRPIKGSVDKQTQRAAWSFADGSNTDIIMETGIYNLTQDQTEVLVHFGKDTTQRWLMVRMEQPQKEDPKAGQDR